MIDSVLKKHPTKFVGCCLANPAENRTGVKQLEDLILKDGYRAIRFNPYLWPSGQQVSISKSFSAIRPQDVSSI
ncbi:4-sulfomuconolactone hydrolase [Gossypium australe]|uniref:4-sulfomuconolactone hydrolase n=1 Tax=Gossypium australe TaxID=47621 RepID=A0A5B6VDV1_9ROSI|nr:4-sulfomuconolactone hydrolase [Gossypium australe]